MPDFIQLAGYVLIFGSILYLAYIASKLVGKKTSAAMQSKHMQVVEQISLGLDRRLLLIRVGSEYFVFLCGKKEFKQVARVNLDREEIQEQTEGKSTDSPVFDFRQILDRVVHRGGKSEPGTRQEETPRPARNETVQASIRKLEQLREKTYDKEV